MSDFSLRHLVRGVLDSSTVNDPHAIASDVLDQIDDADLRTGLRECLPSLVREMIRSSRNGGLLAGASHSASSPSAQPRLTLHAQSDVMAERSDGVPRPVMKAAPAQRLVRSAKVAAIRASGPKWLADRINTAADPREWKRIGDCSFSDLMFAVAERREQVARTSAAADRYERLAELVQMHGVELVRDLPESVLSEVGGAAA